MDYLFIVVGVGGTGSLVARDLPKLILNTANRILLIDGDVVEEKNMMRQAYQRHDIGENKAIALSRKINTFYGNICEAHDGYVTKNEIIEKINQTYSNLIPVIIGCVDNNKSRVLLEQTFKGLDSCVYIDSANSKYDGDVYIVVKENGQTIGKLRSDAYTFDDDVHPAEKSCEAQAAAGNIQYMVTNLKMSNAVIEHVSALLHGEIKVGVTVVHRFETIHICPESRT